MQLNKLFAALMAALIMMAVLRTPATTYAQQQTVDPAGWVHIDFNPTGDHQDVINVDHDGQDNRVTISWFWAGPGTTPPAKACTMHITTHSDGERVTMKGAFRTWRYEPGTPSKDNVYELVSFWMQVLEREPRGGCAHQGDYSITWQDATLNPGGNGRPNVTGAKIEEQSVNPEEDTPTDINAWGESVHYMSDASPLSVEKNNTQVTVAWFHARENGNSDPGACTAYVIAGDAGSIEYEGGARTWTWSRSGTPSPDDVRNLVANFVTTALEAEPGACEGTGTYTVSWSDSDLSAFEAQREAEPTTEPEHQATAQPEPTADAPAATRTHTAQPTEAETPVAGEGNQNGNDRGSVRPLVSEMVDRPLWHYLLLAAVGVGIIALIGLIIWGRGRRAPPAEMHMTSLDRTPEPPHRR